MNRGSSCPIFMNDLKKFLGTHNEVQVNFLSIFSLFLFNFDTNEKELINSMENFIDYMFVFARLERQKVM